MRLFRQWHFSAQKHSRLSWCRPQYLDTLKPRCVQVSPGVLNMVKAQWISMNVLLYPRAHRPGLATLWQPLILCLLTSPTGMTSASVPILLSLASARRLLFRKNPHAHNRSERVPPRRTRTINMSVLCRRPPEAGAERGIWRAEKCEHLYGEGKLSRSMQTSRLHRSPLRFCALRASSSMGSPHPSTQTPVALYCAAC